MARNRFIANNNIIIFIKSKLLIGLTVRDGDAHTGNRLALTICNYTRITERIDVQNKTAELVDPDCGSVRPSRIFGRNVCVRVHVCARLCVVTGAHARKYNNAAANPSPNLAVYDVNAGLSRLPDNVTAVILSLPEI